MVKARQSINKHVHHQSAEWLKIPSFKIRTVADEIITGNVSSWRDLMKFVDAFAMAIFQSLPVLFQIAFTGLIGGRVVIEFCTCDQQVAGSNPGRHAATLGNLFTHMCLCHQAVYNLVRANGRWRSAAAKACRKAMTASPGLWLRSCAGWLYEYGITFSTLFSDIFCVLDWYRVPLLTAGQTSCRRAAATICPRPSPPCRHRNALRRRADDNIAAVSQGQYVPSPTAATAWCANTVVSKAAWWLWPFDLESGVRVTCDVGYLCANFGLPRPLCSRLRPDVRDRR